jgi:hypothetical protein
MVPSVAATAVIGVALAQGALAASFSVSGQSFKVTAKELNGEGFAQYGAVDRGTTLAGKSTAHAVAVSSFTKARIQKMCQSVVTPDVPFIGDVTLKLTAGDSSDPDKQVRAENLYIDVEDLGADAVFTDINIGVAAGSMGSAKGGYGPGMKGGEELANPNGFGQEARLAKLTDVKQTAWATTAGTFKLSGLHMSLQKGKGAGVECY